MSAAASAKPPKAQLRFDGACERMSGNEMNEGNTMKVLETVKRVVYYNVKIRVSRVVRVSSLPM